MTIVLWIGYANETHMRSYTSEVEAQEMYDAAKANGAAVTLWRWA